MLGETMEEFKNKLIELEQKYDKLTYITKIGNTPVLLTAVHTMEQKLEDGKLKYAEPYTKGIAMYVANETNSSYLIKNQDTGVDSNHVFDDTFKRMMIDQIRDNDIKLVIDLHGASITRDFDVEFGNLNNLSTDYSTINELIDSFNENGVFNIKVNEPFKGGCVTQKVYFETNCDVIQIEINMKYRNILDADKINRVCLSLIKFINQYKRILEKD